MDYNEYLQRLRSGPVPKELAFTQTEYDGRVAKVREEMGKAGLDAMIVTSPPNLNYLTGYNTFSLSNLGCLVLPLDGEPAILTACTEIPAAVLSGWVEDVATYGWNETDQLGSRLTDMLKDKGLDSKRIGMELDSGGPVPGLSAELQRTLANARFDDASGLVQRVRVVKSAAELEYMREAGRITSIGINASLRATRAGITDNDVAKVGYEAMVAAGSEFMSTPPIVTTGYRSSWHHTTFRRVPLNEGDVVFLEYSGCYSRYNAPMMRSAVIGQPSKEVKRIAEAVKKTLALVIDGARAGRTSHDVARDAHKGYAGLESEMWFMGIMGYSIGLGFPPTWADSPTFISEGIDMPLLPGMTFHLPIMFRVPRVFGVGLSETIAITETGCEVLTGRDADLFVAAT